MNESIFFLLMMAGFVVLVLGASLVTRELRRRGHGARLDLLHKRGVHFQTRVERALARFLSANPRRFHQNKD